MQHAELIIVELLKQGISMDYLLIEDQDSYNRFVDENQNIDWIGMDTEFIGEKRFFTALCLIQIGTANGNYIIDPIKIKETPYIDELITDPNVVVITHAGANDFRLLYQEYGIKPKNSFDLQIAAAFLGYSYPVSFKFIVDTFLGITLPKTHTVTDWERRPITSAMAKYAVQDVLYLGELYHTLKKKLEEVNRLSWCLDECSKFTKDAFFEREAYPELKSNSFFTKLKEKERIVYLKMLDWRLGEAIRQNRPKESILPVKTLNVLARMHHMSLDHLKNDRRINPRIFELYKCKISNFIVNANGAYKEKIEDLNIVDYKHETVEEHNIDLLTELAKLRAKTLSVAPEIVLTKKTIRGIQSGTISRPFEHEQGWRSEVLGPKLLQWISDPTKMNVVYDEENQQFIIS